MTWKSDAAKRIKLAVRNLPEDTPLAERIKIVDAARPTNWPGNFPYRAWQAARREYLKKYGYKPRTKTIEQHESPLERMMRRAKRAKERRDD